MRPLHVCSALFNVQVRLDVRCHKCCFKGVTNTKRDSFTSHSEDDILNQCVMRAFSRGGTAELSVSIPCTSAHYRGEYQYTLLEFIALILLKHLFLHFYSRKWF